MKEYGFTLIELMGVIIVISLISILAVPPIMNQIAANKDKVSSATETIVMSATELYMENHSSKFSKDVEDGSIYCVQLNELVDEGLLELPFVDQATGKSIDPDRYVKIKVSRDFGDENGEYIKADKNLIVGKSCENSTIALGERLTMGFIGNFILPSNYTNDMIYDDVIVKQGQNIADPSSYTLSLLSGNLSRTEGDYEVIYKLTDEYGRETTTKRNIHVFDGIEEYQYTGNAQEFLAPETGYYKVELWGAQGGDATYSTTYTGGKGAYTSGIIKLIKDEKFYIYVGGLGHTVNGTSVFTVIENANGYNGGAAGTSYVNNSTGGGGGGATDIRFGGQTLNDRIMVAAGGGGAKSHTSKPSYSGNGGAGGTLIGVNGVLTNNTCYAYGTGGAQVTGGSSVNCPTDGKASSGSGTFGIGYSPYSVYTNNAACYAGGGGGYYGGGAGYHAAAGGGSSFISGYAGVNAINSSGTHTNNTIHYSNKYFIDGNMIAGNQSMPNTAGTSTEVGHAGNGYAKITFVSFDEPDRNNDNLNNVRYVRACSSGNDKNIAKHWFELQAIENGTNIAMGKTVQLYNSSTNQVAALTNANVVNDSHVPTLTQTGSTYYGSSGAAGNYCAYIDLGSNHNLDEIASWYYYIDGRTYYANEIYVSSDNVNWKLLALDTSAVTQNGTRVNAYSTPKSLTVNGVELAVKKFDNATWLNIFHHDTVESSTTVGTVFYSNANGSDEVLTTDNSTISKRSALSNIADFIGNDGKYEFLLEYPAISGYNRWKQTANPITTTVASGTTIANAQTALGYQAINISWATDFAGISRALNSGTCYLDAMAGTTDWWYSFGQYAQYSSKALTGPKVGSTGTSAIEIDLWVRIDDYLARNS